MGKAEDIIVLSLKVLGMALLVLFLFAVAFIVIYGGVKQETCQKIDINSYSCKEIGDAILNETSLISCKVSSNLIGDVYFPKDYLFKYYTVKCGSEK